MNVIVVMVAMISAKSFTVVPPLEHYSDAMILQLFCFMIWRKVFEKKEKKSGSIFSHNCKWCSFLFKFLGS